MPRNGGCGLLPRRFARAAVSGRLSKEDGSVVLSPEAPAFASAHSSAAEFNRLIHKYHMYGLWEQEEGVHPVPMPKTEAFMWPASILDEVVKQAGHAVPVGNERRAMQLFNPGFG